MNPIKKLLTLKIYLGIILALYTNFSILPQSEPKEIPKQINPKNQWGYIVSSSLQKFSPDYLDSISKSYEILCINGLELNGKGQLRYTSQFTDKISKSGLKSKDAARAIIYPMIIVSSIRDGIELLNSDKSKRKATDLIVDFLQEQDLKGVHLDIEYLPPSVKNEYVSSATVTTSMGPGVRFNYS